MNYYTILGIDKSADFKKIKKAYRKKAMKYHPDKNIGDKEAENKFKEIAIAYSVLSDKIKKAEYDLMGDGTIDPEVDVKAAFDIFNNFFADISPNYKNFVDNSKITFDNINDILNGKLNFTVNTSESFPINFNKKDDINDNINNNNNINNDNINNDVKIESKKIENNKGVNKIVNINVDLEDVYSKRVKKLKVLRYRDLDGVYQIVKTVLKVPLYSSEIIYKNEGDQIKNTDIYGNIIVNIYDNQHGIFKRINDCDLYTEKDINFMDLYNGIYFSLIHLDNKPIEIKIKKEEILRNDNIIITIKKKDYPIQV